MTSVPQPIPPRQTPAVGSGHCAYCGAPLAPQFYFCRVCATPYKDIETVIPAARPEYLSEGDLIKRKAPHTWPLFWTFTAVVVGAAVAAAVLFQRFQSGMVILLTEGALLVTTCIFAVRHWRSLAVQFKRIGFDHPAAWIGLAVLPVMLGINYLYHTWLSRMAGGEHLTADNPVRQLGLPAAVLFICVLPALLEEITFRGLIQHWLQVAIAPWRALVLASALFMALHFSVVSAPYLFALGALMGWTKWKTGSLYPAMLIHFLHNLIVVVWF